MLRSRRIFSSLFPPSRSLHRPPRPTSENLSPNLKIIRICSILDQVKLAPAGMGGANLEPCDFLSTDKQFIHLKDGHGSVPISHLWNQGVVSAEAFVLDEKFRKDMRSEVQSRQKK